MEQLQQQVSVILLELEHTHLVQVCQYLKCPEPAEGGFSCKNRRALIRMAERKLEEMEESEEEDWVCDYLRELLSFMEEMRGAQKQVNIDPDQSHLSDLKEHYFLLQRSQEQALRDLEEKMRRLSDRLTPLNHSTPEARHTTPHVPPLPEVTLRREFRISGQIGEGGQKDKLSYTSLIHQMEAGLRKGHSEEEVMEAVIRAVTPGLHLRDMLEIKSNLTLSILKTILKGHFREDSASDLYHKLLNISQDPRESAQTFLFRAIELKEKLLWKSSGEDAEEHYSHDLIQRRFLRAIETGLLSDNIKFQVKPYLNDVTVSDETLIERTNEASSLEGERQQKLKKSAMAKSARVCELQTDITGSTLGPPEVREPTTLTSISNEPSPQPKKGKPANSESRVVTHQMLEDLTAEVGEMKKVFLAAMETVMPHQQQRGELNSHPAPRGRYSGQTRQRSRGCIACEEAQRGEQCIHCFRCGETGHVSRGCRRPRQMTGNESGLLRWDQQ